MIKIIGYTDSVNECDCCGKTELKGTYCVEVDGEELYYGSVCAFKAHGLTIEDQKELTKQFKAKQKNEALYAQHIAPVLEEMKTVIANTFTTTDYDSLTEVAKKIYNQIVTGYRTCVEYRAKKYKITLPNIW